jgi:hypothetical protein
MNPTKVAISVKETSTLVRARFGPGMLLQHEDLEQLNTYTRELSRLLFRSFFGCGVVCGLEVKPVTKCGKVTVTVKAGLALDCDGDPVHLPKDQIIVVDEDCTPNLPDKLWVLLCGTTACCAPRTSSCASDEDEAPSVCTRERDGFELRIVSESELPKCICGSRKGYERYSENDCRCVNPQLAAYKDHYAGNCGCHAGQDCDCSCDCILLARLDNPYDETKPWSVDHSVRRFVRPVLMRDPLTVAPQPDPYVPPPTAPPAPELEAQPPAAPQAARPKRRR